MDLDKFFDGAENCMERGCDTWNEYFTKLGPRLKKIGIFLLLFVFSPILIPILLIVYITGYVSLWRENRETTVRD
jgi:hypothetical protein